MANPRRVKLYYACCSHCSHSETKSPHLHKEGCRDDRCIAGHRQLSNSLGSRNR